MLSISFDEKKQIIETIRLISNSIAAEVFTLWDGLQDEKAHEPQPDEQSLVDKLAANEDAISMRWNPNSVRLSVTSIPSDH